jgi:ribosomal protein S27E
MKCGGRSFEVKDAEPQGSKHKFLFVQCTSCGGVVGVINHSHLPTMLRRIGEKLGVDM